MRVRKKPRKAKSCFAQLSFSSLNLSSAERGPYFFFHAVLGFICHHFSFSFSGPAAARSMENLQREFLPTPPPLNPTF